MSTKTRPKTSGVRSKTTTPGRPGLARPTSYSVTARSPARTWLMALGWILLATAILGLIPAVADVLHELRFHIEGGENLVHWVLAAATLAVVYLVKDEALLSTLAVVFGFILLATGILGMFADRIGPWHVGMGDNIVHLLLGAVTLAAGVMARSRRGTTGRYGRAAV